MVRYFVENEFDVAVAKSLFTHLLPEELDIYLRSIADRLRTGGKALLTFFILNEEQQRLAALDKNHMYFIPIAKTSAVPFIGRWRRPQPSPTNRIT